MRQEIQAIVLAAGPGMRMTTLTNRTPKCLLPLGTLPMIYYPLYSLQQAGFTDVTVVVSRVAEVAVRKLVEQYCLKLNLDVVVVNTSEDPGTADSLREVFSKIKKNVDNVMLLSCDLVTDSELLPILSQHHERGAALTMLVANLDEDYVKAQPPGPKTKPSIGSDIICTEEDNGQLLYSVAGGDYDDVINLSAKVVAVARSAINVSTKMLDAHLYIMKRWLVDYILNEKSPCSEMGSLKAEIIPHVISCQLDKPDTSQKQPSSSKSSIHDFIEHDMYDDLIRSLNTSTILSPYSNTNPLPKNVCYSYKHSGFCVRVNTLNSYWHLNKQIHLLFDKVCPGSPWSLKHPTADIQPKAQVGEDCVLGMSSVICDKTNITNSVIGNHCRINSLTRISNSVLAHHITVTEGCVIDNCLIFANIEKKCSLKNCIVTDPNRIMENETYLNEVLEASQDYTE